MGITNSDEPLAICYSTILMFWKGACPKSNMGVQVPWIVGVAVMTGMSSFLIFRPDELNNIFIAFVMIGISSFLTEICLEGPVR